MILYNIHYSAVVVLTVAQFWGEKKSIIKIYVDRFKAYNLKIIKIIKYAFF